MVPATALVPMQATGGVFFIGLLLIVLHIVAMIWVYSDAQTNSPHSAVLWTLVVFFGGVLGLLLYVLIGRGGSSGRSTNQTQF